MGIYLGHNIFPERIHPEAWSRDPTQTKQAQDSIFEHLAEKVHRSILTDSTRLIEKIYRSKEHETIEALEQFNRVYRNPPDATHEILKYLVVDRSDKALAREWFLRHLQAHPAESTSAGEAYMNWFDATGDLADLFGRFIFPGLHLAVRTPVQTRNTPQFSGSRRRNPH